MFSDRDAANSDEGRRGSSHFGRSGELGIYTYGRLRTTDSVEFVNCRFAPSSLVGMVGLLSSFICYPMDVLSDASL